MNIESLNGIQTASANSAAASSTGATNSAGAQRDMFMTLLVAQLKNQDPLQPQDGAQFVAQLTQFNSLDQLVGIRQALDQLVTAQHPTDSGTDSRRIV